MTFAFDPAIAGTTVLAVQQPPGFETPSAGTQRTATVVAPDVRFNNLNNASVNIGLDLQKAVTVSLEAAPPEAVDVTITSTAGTITTITQDGTMVGGTSVTFLGVTGTSVGTIFVQGLSSGSGELTGQAAGYDDGFLDVTVVPSGFVHQVLNVISTTVGAANINFPVGPAALNSTTLNFAEFQQIRGGISVDVEVASSDTSVGTIVGNPQTINGGSSQANFEFDPMGVGTTTLTVQTPAGFSTPSNRKDRTANVNP